MLFTVQKARKYAGFTQAEMGKMMNIHRQTYARIERNPDSATIEQAKRIAELTHIPVDEIFFGKSST